MTTQLNRRQFLQVATTGSALLLSGLSIAVTGEETGGSQLISPGCRTSRVKVARLYMGTSHGLWPKPDLDFQKEMRFYETQFARYADQLSDVDFVVDQLVTSPEDILQLQDRLNSVDGILAVHFNIGIQPILEEILRLQKPTVVFADPYSGHEWVNFGTIQKQPSGAKLGCMLTSDYSKLVTAIRPMRAVHHLREAKILNVTTRSFDDYASAAQDKFGTEIVPVSLDRIVTLYHSIDDRRVREEAARWTNQAVRVIEPSPEVIRKSCRMALAFEQLLHEEQATVVTVDCYGTMYEPLCRKYAYPCIGFTRLNNMGFGGICESDLRSAMIHILFQGLSGKPGFINDPTVDESIDSIILAHCLGTTKMDGPDGPAAPYQLRTIMERREGAVPQVKMQLEQQVTTAIIEGMDTLRYFTGTITAVPETERGCRTKITVRVDGDITRLWKNWASGLHRVTCYGNLTEELELFAGFTDMQLINEAA